jgi:glycosyl transferase family 25
MKNGTVGVGSRMGRGQIGCYDSHVRVWENIISRKTPMTLIMEDDANIRHTQSVYQQIKNGFDEAKRLKIDWDIFYLGVNNGGGAPTKLPTPKLVKPRGCNGLFAYVLTLQGAQKLLSKCKPYVLPVDVLVGNLHDAGVLKAIALNPRLCYVVPVRSDTRNII